MRTSRPVELSRDGVIHRGNYRSNDYWRALHGVYVSNMMVDTSDEWAQRRLIATARARAAMAKLVGVEFVLYGPTALLVLGVPLPHRLYDWDNCHILIPWGSPRPRCKGVIAHRAVSMPSLIHWVDGLPLLHPIDHWLQLRNAFINELVEVGDGLVRRQQPLVQLAEFAPRIAAAGKIHGIRNMRAALPLIMPGTDSLYETRTRLVLVQSGLPTPPVNLRVVFPDADTHFSLDMAYEEARVAVEYDGLVHVGNRAQMEYDAWRRGVLEDHGWRLITVTSSMLQESAQVVRRVRQALDRRARS